MASTWMIVSAAIIVLVGIVVQTNFELADEVVFLLSGFSLAGPIAPCLHPYSAQPRSEPSCFFKSNYYDAREAFIRQATLSGAELRSLVVVPGEDELTIDIAVLHGSNESLVLHISGTHGTEGYGGSAIQTGWLREGVGLKKWRLNPTRPTIIFVHALNPYGMAHWRRWNEDNIDLNRNCILLKEGWSNPDVFGRDEQGRPWNKKNNRFWNSKTDGVIPALDRHPNEFGYDNFARELFGIGGDALNLWSDVEFVFNVIKQTVLGHVDDIKLATVSGTYHEPNGIFFGGRQLAKSNALLAEYLQFSHPALLKSVTKFLMIDVHTGLGPFGRDTLMADDHAPYVTQMFDNGDKPKHTRPFMITGLDESDNAASGYDNVAGLVNGATGLPTLFPACTNVSQCVSFTQEFGTLPGALVLKALVQENTMYHSGNEADRLPYAQRMFDAFTPQKQSFYVSVLDRGLTVLDQATAP